MFYLEETIQPIQLGVEPSSFKDIEKVLSSGEWYAEHKIDGIRLIMIVKPDKSFKVETRNGKNVTDKFKQIFPYYEKLINRGLSVLKDGLILDGEFYYKSIFQTQSILFTRNKEVPKADYEWFIFDVLPLEAWRKRHCQLTYLQRRKLLDKILPKPIKGFKKLEHFKINSYSDAKKVFESALKHGYEGLMLKKADSLYRFKRTKDWVKMKPSESKTFKCIDVKEGTGKNKGKLGAIIIDYNGKKVQVGSGFSDEQREYYWKNKNKIIGKCVDVEYYSVTNGKSLRFPRFIKVRDDKTKC